MAEPESERDETDESPQPQRARKDGGEPDAGAGRDGSEDGDEEYGAAEALGLDEVIEGTSPTDDEKLSFNETRADNENARPL